MTDLFILLHTLASSFRNRTDLILEYLLLRRKLQGALRSKHRLPLRPRARLIWLVVRRMRPTGAATSSSSGRKRSLAGIGVAGDGAGGGDRGLGWGAFAYPVRSAR